jgi:hypothetical protein
MPDLFNGGITILRITFRSENVIADGKALPAAAWSYGDYRGVPGVLRIHCDSAQNVVIAK